MTIQVFVKGTSAEMDKLFDTRNIRYFHQVGDKWCIGIRHNENIFKRVRTIKGLEKKFASYKQ